MKESVRQLSIFIIILFAGIILVVFDIPFVYLVAGTAILCVLVLILAGAVRFPTIRKSRTGATQRKVKISKEAPAATTQTEGYAGTDNRGTQKTIVMPVPQEAPRKTGKAAKNASKSARISGIRLIGDAIHEGFHIFVSDLSKRKRKTVIQSVSPDKTKETDHLRDASVEAVPVVKRAVEDPFRDLVKEEGDTGLLDKVSGPGATSLAPFEGMDEFDGLELPPGAGITHADLSSVEESPNINIDEETGDEVAEILESHKEELNPEVPGSELSGFEELDSLDLGSIDLDEGIDLDAEIATPPPPGKEPGVPSASTATDGSQKIPQTGTGSTVREEPFGKSTPFSMSDVKASSGPVRDTSEQDTMLSFASGSPGDDDLISSLRTEVGQTKRKSNESLLRDLKDTRVPASDLAKELESVLLPAKERDSGSPSGKRTEK